jgi:hypothetical protein
MKSGVRNDRLRHYWMRVAAVDELSRRLSGPPSEILQTAQPPLRIVWKIPYGMALFIEH